MHHTTDPSEVNAGTQQAEAAGADPSEPTPVDALRAELEQLATDRDSLKDLLQRNRAEFDNFRRRVEREKSELAEYGAMELMRSVVTVLDDFDRAVAVSCADREYAKGIELIHQRFSETLKKQGLEPIDSKGRKFDPNLHQAVDRTPSEEVEEDTVIDEFQKGYHYKGKLLRPAMVRVAVRG